jgi:hypothetical protein
VATAGDTTAAVSFSAPASNGGATITSYTVTSSPGNRSVTGATSPLTVTGLTNGTVYTFTVRATNEAGQGPASDPSNSVTPAIQGFDSSGTFSPSQIDNNISSVPPNTDLQIQGSGSVVEGVVVPPKTYFAKTIAPVSQTVTYSPPTGRVGQVNMTGLPAGATKVIVGTAPDLVSSTAYIFVRLYDSSGTPITSFPPVTVQVNVPSFTGDSLTVRHVTTGEEILATRISTGRYEFTITTNPEYQLLDNYIGGILYNVSLPNVKITTVIRPATNGRFSN